MAETKTYGPNDTVTQAPPKGIDLPDLGFAGVLKDAAVESLRAIAPLAQEEAKELAKVLLRAYLDEFTSRLNASRDPIAVSIGLMVAQATLALLYEGVPTPPEPEPAEGN